MSLKGDAYETAEEVKFRLEGTVVLYDGSPVYITRVNMAEEREAAKEIARVFFTPLPILGEGRGAGGLKETRKYLSSKKFDLAPFPMGYFNYNGQAVFASRLPVRQNKQGLSSHSASFKDVRGNKGANCNFNNAVRSQGFVDMLNNKYPTFQEAGEMLGNDAQSSVAVSRSFAFIIDHDIESLFLMHRGVRCGVASKGQKGLRLPPKFHFLREEAEECRIPLI